MQLVKYTKSRQIFLVTVREKSLTYQKFVLWNSRIRSRINSDTKFPSIFQETHFRQLPVNVIVNVSLKVRPHCNGHFCWWHKLASAAAEFICYWASSRSCFLVRELSLRPLWCLIKVRKYSNKVIRRRSHFWLHRREKLRITTKQSKRLTERVLFLYCSI